MSQHSSTQTANEVEEAAEIIIASSSKLVEAYKAGVVNIDDLKTAMAKGDLTAKQYAQAVNGLSNRMTLIGQTVTTVNSAVTGFNTLFATAANLLAGNVDQQVALYQATISAISAQNTYTQALALQSTAVAVYGANSEQATRATTAASYVGALYVQAKKNETVAQEQYYTATATNLASMASGVMSIIGVIADLSVAITAFKFASIASAAQITAAATEVEIDETAIAIGGAGIFKSGGYVPKTGLALVHEGEYVVPKAGVEATSSYGPSNVSSEAGSGMPAMAPIEIHIHASSNVDLPRVRQEVQTAIAKSWLAASKQRGVYG